MTKPIKNFVVERLGDQVRTALQRHFRMDSGGILSESDHQIIDSAVFHIKKDKTMEIAVRKRKATIHAKTRDLFDK